MLKKTFSNKFLTILIIIIATLNAAYNLHKKQLFHVDEIFSYAHANSNRGAFFDPKDNSNNIYHEKDLYKFTHQWYNTEEFNQYLTAQPDSRFNYQNTINNLKKDVHPPLFHILLHTVSSFMPQKLSKYQAGSINLIAYVLTLIMIYKLARKFFKQRLIANLIIAFYGFSNVGIASVVFLRMYALQTLFTTGLVYKTICFLQKPQKKQHLYQIYLWSTLNILTQYNSLIFSFILTAAVSIIFLFNKNYKTLLKYDFVMLLSALTLFICFAPNDVFSQSQRSTRALSSLFDSVVSFDNTLLWIESIVYTLITKIFTPHLFSTLTDNQIIISVVLAASAVIYALRCKKNTKKTIPNHKTKKQIYMLLTVLGLIMPVNSIILATLLKFSDKLYTPIRKHLTFQTETLAFITFIMLIITYLTVPYMGSFGIRYYMFLMPLITILSFKLIISTLSLIHINNKTTITLLIIFTLLNINLADFKNKSPYAFQSTPSYEQLLTEIHNKPVIVIQQGIQGVLTFYERMTTLLNAKSTYTDRIENVFYKYLLTLQPNSIPEIPVFDENKCAPKAVEQMKQHPDAVVLILKTPTLARLNGTPELIDLCPNLKDILTPNPYTVLIGERQYFVHHIKKSLF